MSWGRRNKCLCVSEKEGSKVKTGLTVARKEKQLSRIYL